jgi:hypothetical protein
MQRESSTGRGAIGVALQPLQSGVHGLQGEQLLTGPGTHGDAVGDGVADQVIQWAGFREVGKPRVLHVALDDTAALQRSPDALGNLLDEDLQILYTGLWHMAEHRLPGLVDQVHPIQQQHVKVDVQIEC